MPLRSSQEEYMRLQNSLQNMVLATRFPEYYISVLMIKERYATSNLKVLWRIVMDLTLHATRQ